MITLHEITGKDSTSLITINPAHLIAVRRVETPIPDSNLPADAWQRISRAQLLLSDGHTIEVSETYEEVVTRL